MYLLTLIIVKLLIAVYSEGKGNILYKDEDRHEKNCLAIFSASMINKKF